MARPLRVEYPGAFYHVINRGNAGEDLFRSKRDREKFLEYFEKTVEQFSIKIHTYCLMTNHYHFLVETPEANLSRAVQWLNVSYAVYFNRKRQRSGHLFQGRNEVGICFRVVLNQSWWMRMNTSNNFLDIFI
ncbi:MAG: transposase [Deltaproteobacteria bacterium]|nr:transposase [Deltaproteobacteria bacterium]